MHSKKNQDWKVDSRPAADCTRIKAIATLGVGELGLGI
jgi:hypothetical protein